MYRSDRGRWPLRARCIRQTTRPSLCTKDPRCSSHTDRTRTNSSRSTINSPRLPLARVVQRSQGVCSSCHRGVGRVSHRDHQIEGWDGVVPPMRCGISADDPTHVRFMESQRRPNPHDCFVCGLTLACYCNRLERVCCRVSARVCVLVSVRATQA